MPVLTPKFYIHVENVLTTEEHTQLINQLTRIYHHVPVNLSYQFFEQAVHLGHVDSVRQLGLKPEDLNKYENGWTLAHITARAGNAQVLSLLHELGANLNTTQGNGATPISPVAVAIRFNHFELVKLLVEWRVASPKLCLLYIATKSENPGEAFTIFINMLNISLTTIKDFDIFFPLLKVEKYDLLPKLCNPSRLSMLYALNFQNIAPHFEHIKIFANLRRAGIPLPLGQNKKLFSAMNWAIERNAGEEIHTDILEFIDCFSPHAIKANKKVAWNLATLAVHVGDCTILEKLVACGVDLSQLNNGITTLVHIAVGKGGNDKLPVLRMLRDSGVSLDVKNKKGCTAAFAALNASQIAHLESLAALGADLNLTNKNGDTLAHALVKNSIFKVDYKLQILTLLFQKGVPLEEKNHAGKTPWDFIHTKKESWYEKKIKELKASASMLIADNTEEENTATEQTTSSSSSSSLRTPTKRKGGFFDRDTKRRKTESTRNQNYDDTKTVPGSPAQNF